MDPFVPLFRNPHLQTIAAHFWPSRLDVRRFPVEQRLIETEPGIRVLMDSQRPRRESIADVVIVHGMESSSRSRSAMAMARTALLGGVAAHRLNLRSCGGTECYSKTGYHAGMTCDLLAVLQRLAVENGRPAWVIGFSLGGNVALKLAGELSADAGGVLAGVCGISVPIDLNACVQRLEERRNRIYERRFVHGLKRRVRKLQAGNLDPQAARTHSLRKFDDLVTAPAFGFSGAEEYYRTQSSKPFLSKISVPALLILAKDDPFIPFDVVDGTIPILAADHGGHLGFLARRPPRLWAAQAAIQWILSHQSGTNHVGSPSPV